MSKNSVKIRIEGDASGFEKELKNIEKSAKSQAATLAAEYRKSGMSQSEAMKKAWSEIERTSKQKTKTVTDGFEEEAEVAEEAAEKIKKANQNAMDSQADAVAGLNKVAKGLAATAVAVGGAVLGTGVAFNSQIEQYTAGFKTMLGSAEKADETLGKLREFASVTPFELTDLANASTTLLAFGEDVNNLMPDLKMLGDISLGNKEKFNSLALVFGQVQSQGRLMGQDLLQMINSGFNPLKVISEQTGESMTSLKDKMAKGQISFEMVADAMKVATSEGGQFFNAMEEQSKTLKGQFSTLADNVKDFAGTVSEDLSGHLTNKVLPALIDKVDDLKDAWEDGSLQKNLGLAAAAATTFGVAVAGMNIALVIKDIHNLTKGVEAYTAVTKLGTIAQKGFNAAQAATPWGLVAIAVASLVGGLITYAAVTEDATNATTELAKEIEESRKEYDETIKSIDASTSEQLTEIKVVDTLRDKLYELQEQLNSNTLSEELAKKKKEEFNAVADELNSIIPGVIDNISTETGKIVIQKNAINDLIKSYKDLAIAKAYADAYQEKMTAAAKRAIDAEEKFIEADKNLTKVNRDLNDEAIEAWELAKVGSQGEAPINSKTGKKWTRTAFIATYKATHGEGVTALDTYETTKKDLEEANAAVEKWSSEYTETMAKLGGAAEETGDTFNGVVTDATGTIENETEKQETAISQSLKAVLDIVENSHKLGIISDKEYYDAMGKIRDTYFEEGSEEWQDYTEDIENYYSETLKALKDKMDSFSQRLQDDTNNTYATITLTADGETKSWTTLADMDTQNAQLEEYLSLLNEVKAKRGNIPDAALAELEQMGTEEALTFLKTMVNASDTEWNRWYEGIQENIRLTEEISKNFYADELKENEELIQKLKDQWGELPEGFFDVGAECAEKYGEGLKNVLNGVLSEIKAEIASTFSVGPSSAIISTSAGGASTSTTYTDNRTTNIYANNTSARAIIEADKQSQIYQAHTTSFGG